VSFTNDGPLANGYPEPTLNVAKVSYGSVPPLLPTCTILPVIFAEFKMLPFILGNAFVGMNEKPALG
jgi:hypothetical protein